MRIEKLSDLRGIWSRSLLVQPDGSRDETTRVTWAQGPSLYIDLRQPALRPDFSHVSSLSDLTPADCAWLATQQGFAGVFRQDGVFFEWVRELDFQPPAGPDSGRLFWQDDVLVETGRYADYLEHWHRAEISTPPHGAARLRDADGRPGMLVRLGERFMFARGRLAPLPDAANLAEAVAGAASLSAAQALLDCEISEGNITTAGWTITHSTLPFRVGANLALRSSGEIMFINEVEWRIQTQEGDFQLH